jgi:hypothetical protein
VTALSAAITTPALFHLTNVAGNPMPSSTHLMVVPSRRAVLLEALVSGTPALPPTGSVEFFDTFRGKRRLIGTTALVGGVAKLAVQGSGKHLLQAVYLADGIYSGSACAPVVFKGRGRSAPAPLVRLRRLVGG